jgi:hypothetical protein
MAIAAKLFFSLMTFMTVSPFSIFSLRPYVPFVPLAVTIRYHDKGSKYISLCVLEK